MRSVLAVRKGEERKVGQNWWEKPSVEKRRWSNRKQPGHPPLYRTENKTRDMCGGGEEREREMEGSQWLCVLSDVHTSEKGRGRGGAWWTVRVDEDAAAAAVDVD